MQLSTPEKVEAAVLHFLKTGQSKDGLGQVSRDGDGAFAIDCDGHTLSARAVERGWSVAIGRHLGRSRDLYEAAKLSLKAAGLPLTK